MQQTATATEVPCLNTFMCPQKLIILICLLHLVAVTVVVFLFFYVVVMVIVMLCYGSLSLTFTLTLRPTHIRSNQITKSDHQIKSLEFRAAAESACRKHVMTMRWHCSQIAGRRDAREGPRGLREQLRLLLRRYGTLSISPLTLCSLTQA